MKKMFSKKFAAVSVSILAAGTGLILACAGDWEPESANSNFTPQAFVDSSYLPFFYSSEDFYYGIGHDMNHDARFNGSNATDWATYIGKATTKTELETLLYKTPASAIDSSWGYVNGKIKTTPVGLGALQLFKNRSDKKVQAFISYLTDAKHCEDFAANNFEWSWDYDSKKEKKVTISTTLKGNLQEGFTKSKDLFLKQRYWFQLVRYCFFNEPLQSAIDLFEQNEKLFPKNEMYYRTQAYAAGAYYKLKNYNKANYYYSKVYDGCADLKTVAHFSFHPQEEADWKATLALATTPDEKATLWQMLGIFYSDEKRSIQEIYTLNPRSEKLDLLLVRAVNAQEYRFNTYDDAVRGTHLQLKKDTVDSQLLALVTRIAQAGNTSKPYLWQMAAGYLTLLNGNTEKAAGWLSQAEKKASKDQLVQYQLRLLKLVTKMAGVKQVTPKLENEIVADLDWLRVMNKATDPVFRSSNAYGWIKQLLSKKYIAQHEPLKAVCFVNYNSFYLNNANIEAMKTFLAKPNKTPYEQLCTDLYVMKSSDLLEYQAICATYAGKLDEAIAKMQQADSGTVMPGNPFNGRLQDCHDCDFEAPQKIKYTRLSLLKKMKDMDDNVKAGKDVFTNAMLLANAYYNISHYGNGRVFYECSVVGAGHYSPYAIDSVFRNMLTDMKPAIKYYTAGLAAAKTDEQKAKCYFMLAKCERNQWYNTSLYYSNTTEWSDNKQPDFMPWNSFKSLKQYANTKFYNEAIKECGYFRSYTKSSR